ncbi:MAG: dihydrodipicolinate synthase family protein [Chloroflexi bacterium]|nr:dihydrodipicolinate synthase family protein [Chloroflexota bacterium]
MNTIAQLRQKLQHGVSPAMATPLKEDGYTVDTAAIPPLVNFLVERGIKGLFVGGTTGEGVLLNAKQRKILHEVTLEAVAGRVPVLLHTAANQLAEAENLTHHAASLGADGLVAMTPYFLGMSEEALFQYFVHLASLAPHIPFFAYDIPQLAVNGVSPKLLGRLCAAIPNLAGLKCSRDDMQLIRQLLDVLPADKFLLAGNERIALGSIALGADGMISGLSTAVPEPFVACLNAFYAGDYQTALDWQKRINRGLDHMPADRIGAIKRILAERGIPVGNPMPPRGRVETAVWPAVEEILINN